MTAVNPNRTLMVVRIALAGLLLVTFAASAHADEWTKTDTAIEAAVLTTFALDYLQTRQIVEDGREGNPIIGLCGGRVGDAKCDGISPELYFGGLAIAHVAAMRLLPHRWRNAAQGLTVGIQIRSLRNNYAAGYTFRF